MDLEQIVQQILLMRHDLSREEVLKKILEKKLSAQDYFLDEVAARLVASDLGVEVPSAEDAFQPEIAIKDLVSGLNDVTVIGRVISVYPVQTFSRSDLTEGKVARLLLADKTASLRLVLWNDKIHMVDAGKIRQGQIVRVLHGYAREGIDGKLELHLGDKGGLEVSPSSVVENDYPQVADFIEKIGKLTPAKKRTNIVGVVHEVFPQSEFMRQNGTAGKVRRLRLRDNTGEAVVVVWNERVEELGDVKRGDGLRIMNVRLKETPDGRLELHVENATQIEKLSEQETAVSVATQKLTKIANIQSEGGPFTVEATVASQPDTREVTTYQGEKVLVTSFDIADETGKMRASLWRDQADSTKNLTTGTKIRLINVHAKRGFSNLIELASRKSTTVEKVSTAEVVT